MTLALTDEEVLGLAPQPQRGLSDAEVLGEPAAPAAPAPTLTPTESGFVPEPPAEPFSSETTFGRRALSFGVSDLTQPELDTTGMRKITPEDMAYIYESTSPENAFNDWNALPEVSARHKAGMGIAVRDNKPIELAQLQADIEAAVHVAKPGLLKRFGGVIWNQGVIELLNTPGRVVNMIKALDDFFHIPYTEENLEKVDEMWANWRKRTESTVHEVELYAPSVKLTPAETFAEKTVDGVAGLSVFIAQTIILRKILPSNIPFRKSLTWEIPNQIGGGFPGTGALMEVTFGTVGELFPGKTFGAMAKRGVVTAGLFGGTTAATGGDTEEIIINSGIGVVFMGMEMTGKAWALAKPKNKQAIIQAIKTIRPELGDRSFAEMDTAIAKMLPAPAVETATPPVRAVEVAGRAITSQEAPGAKPPVRPGEPPGTPAKTLAEWQPGKPTLPVPEAPGTTPTAKQAPEVKGEAPRVPGEAVEAQAQAGQVPETTSIKNAYTDQRAAEMGYAERATPERLPNKEVADLALAEHRQDPQAVEKVIDSIAADPSKPPTLRDEALLGVRLREVRNQLDSALDKKIAQSKTSDTATQAETEQTIARLRGEETRVIEATRASGTTAGRALQFRNTELKADYSLARVTRDWADKHGGIEPPPKVLANLKAKTERIAELEAKVRELETARRGPTITELETTVAELEATVRGTAPRSRLFTDEMVSRAEANLKTRLSRLNVGVDPAIVTDLSVLLGRQIENGFFKLADAAAPIIKKLGEKIRPFLEDAWKMALMNRRELLRPTVPAKEAKPVKPAKTQARLNTSIRATEKSIAEYERRIREGDVAAKTRQPGPTSPELEALRSRRDALRAEYDELRALANPKATPEERARKSYITRKTNELAVLQEKLAKGDYSVEERPVRKLSPEETHLREEVNHIKWQLDQLRMSGLERAWRNFLEVGAIFRMLQAAGDISNVGRQLEKTAWIDAKNLALLKPSANFPRLAWWELVTFFSERKFNEIDAWMKTLPERALLDKYALTTETGIDTPAARREEFYPSGKLNKIPIIRAGNRAAVTGTNLAAHMMYQELVPKLEAKGRFSTAKQQRKAAVWIGDMIGRGVLPDAKIVRSATEISNALLYSTRYTWSRVHSVATLFGTLSTDPVIRRQGLETLAGGTLKVAALALVLRALGWDTDTNPLSPDFLKAKKGNTRMDLTGGHGIVIRLMARLGYSAYLQGFGAPKEKAEDRSQIIMMAAKGKAAPLISGIWKVTTGRDAFGKEIKGWEGWGEEARNQFLFMWLNDGVDAFKDAYAENPDITKALLWGVGATGISWTGVGVQTYQKTPKKKGLIRPAKVGK